MAERTNAEKLDDLAAIDREGRVGRTAVQVGIPAAIVGIGTYFARLADLDLDPGAGRDMPADVVAYFITVVAFGIAWRMNRRPTDQGDT